MAGCEINCSTMTDHTQDHKFVVARSEVVQFFTFEERAQCFAFEGEGRRGGEGGGRVLFKDYNMCMLLQINEHIYIHVRTCTIIIGFCKHVY